MRKYIFKNKAFFIINAVLITIKILLNTYIAFILKDLVDLISNKMFNDLYKEGIFAVCYFAFSIAIGFATAFLNSLFLKKVFYDLKDDIFSSLINLNIKTFNEKNTGEYASIFNNDINIIIEDYFWNIFHIYSDILSFTIGTVVIFTISPLIALAVFSVAIMIWLFSLVVGRNIGVYRKDLVDSLGNFNVKIKEYFGGFETIKTFGIEKIIKEHFGKSNEKVEKSRYKFNIISSFVQIIYGFLGIAIFFIVLFVGAYLAEKDRITVGLLIAVIQLVNNIIDPTTTLAHRVNRFKAVKPISQKITQIMGSSSKTDNGIDKNNFLKEIAFKEVSFSYNDERKIIDNASFCIEKGKKYALIGTSGSGKTTLIKLMMKYYPNFEGSILIDGNDIRDIKTLSMCNLISVIHQNIFIFNDSLRINITLGKKFDDNTINKAIVQSGLSNFVSTLKDGLDSIIDENATNISGGEKYRIGIARALIKNSPILVMDEATSSLDNKTANEIEKQILEIENLTCIVITHKLVKELLEKYDGLFILKDGKIVEFGTFEECLEKKGYFYSLYNVFE
ncbi:ABC transporter ATP-binding protein [Pseudoclostridium thermosuccinogenes]|uniref:ABC transporter ATP-binding protein n=1 Tax=Clostridium thermosuccinogenes TaxID=84032 RepID=UPI002FD8BCA3